MYVSTLFAAAVSYSCSLPVNFVCKLVQLSAEKRFVCDSQADF